MRAFTKSGSNVVRRALGMPLRAQCATYCSVSKAPRACITFKQPNTALRSARSFRTSPAFQGIMPDAEDPAPRQAEELDQPTVPTDIPTSEFHDRANEYLDELVSTLEEQQEQNPDVEVEFSDGVLEVKVLSKGHTYVFNKQPANKQIWLASPISGPKRFDWVVSGESMHEKEGGGAGDWVYLRDGTSLTDIVRVELGVALGKDLDAPS